MKLEEILKLSVDDRIKMLKGDAKDIPKWEELVKEYDPKQHEIMTDNITRVRKKLKRGYQEPARVTYALQKLAVNRMAQMAFAIPVERVYTDREKYKEQIEAIEAIYGKTRIDSVNRKRFKALFASCEMASVWYAYEKKNDDYGFNSRVKLRCVSYSPMEERFSGIKKADIYPLFDEMGDMIALSFETVVKENDKDVTYFTTLTDKAIYTFRNDVGWEELEPIENSTGKILAVYTKRYEPIWESATGNTTEIEYTLSRQSDVIRRNSAPVLKVAGTLVEEGDKPEGDASREVYQLKEGGDIGFAESPINTESVSEYIKMLKDNTEEELQLPNLSAKNISNAGLSGEARKHILTDAHLKVGDEEGDIIEFLDREFNVIKALLAKMEPKWAEGLKEIQVEHVLTPFTMTDEKDKFENVSKITGGKAVASLKTAVRELGLVRTDAIDEEVADIIEDEARLNMHNAFEPTL